MARSNQQVRVLVAGHRGALQHHGQHNKQQRHEDCRLPDLSFSLFLEAQTLPFSEVPGDALLTVLTALLADRAQSMAERAFQLFSEIDRDGEMHVDYPFFFMAWNLISMQPLPITLPPPEGDCP